MTTAVQVQYRRGSAAQVASFTGAAGELVVDTTNNRVVVEDGATAGGFPAAKLSEVVTSVASSGGSTISQSGGVATIGEPGGFLNQFRNGAMDVWQRGTSMSTLAATGTFYYTADGWMVESSGAAASWAQAGGRLLTKNSLQVTGATGVTDVQIKQRIESLMAARFSGQTVTVQAQIYNNTGAAITPTLTVNRPTAQDNYASVATDVNAVGLQSCPNGQWTRVAYTFAANAAAYNGLEILFDFGNNFSASTKSIQITELDIRATPGVATGLNALPPPPELRPINIELAFCQRYFASSFLNGVAPADDSVQQNYSGPAPAATLAQVSFIPFPVPMRATPAMTFYSPNVGTPSAGEWSVDIGGTWNAATATAIAGGGSAISALNFAVNVTLSGGLAVNGCYVIGGSWTASAEL